MSNQTASHDSEVSPHCGLQAVNLSKCPSTARQAGIPSMSDKSRILPVNNEPQRWFPFDCTLILSLFVGFDGSLLRSVVICIPLTINEQSGNTSCGMWPPAQN
jgi:hypothetical protein